jgi:hypothetical protein
MIREWYRDCSVYGTSTNGAGQTASPVEELAERRTLERYYGTYSSDGISGIDGVRQYRCRKPVYCSEYARSCSSLRQKPTKKEGGTLSELMRATEERAISLCC